jgi:hypothetical protein
VYMSAGSGGMAPNLVRAPRPDPQTVMRRFAKISRVAFERFSV